MGGRTDATSTPPPPGTRRSPSDRRHARRGVSPRCRLGARRIHRGRRLLRDLGIPDHSSPHRRTGNERPDRRRRFLDPPVSSTGAGVGGDGRRNTAGDALVGPPRAMGRRPPRRRCQPHLCRQLALRLRSAVVLRIGCRSQSSPAHLVTRCRGAVVRVVADRHGRLARPCSSTSKGHGVRHHGGRHRRDRVVWAHGGAVRPDRCFSRVLRHRHSCPTVAGRSRACLVRCLVSDTRTSTRAPHLPTGVEVLARGTRRDRRDGRRHEHLALPRRIPCDLGTRSVCRARHGDH